MAEAVLAELLSAEGAVLSDPADVERALAQLWREGHAPQAGETDQPAATRVCAANLIVVGPADAWSRISDDLGQLSPMYPTRTLVLLLQNENSVPDEPVIRASVSALCHLPQPGRPQVCCEQVVLRGTGRPCRSLDRTLLPLLESDVPTMVWWTVDPQRCRELFDAMITLADRMIVDAGSAGVDHLESVSGCVVRALGWYRTARWRQLIAGMFDGLAPVVAESINAVRLTMGGSSVEEKMDAVWLVAFLAGQLGWQPESCRGASAVFASPAGRVEVEMTCGDDGSRPGLDSLTIACPANRFEIARCPACPTGYQITEHNAHVCQLPRGVEIRPVSRAVALADAFTGRFQDASFARAVPIARWLIEQGKA